jgi:uncharacterized protein (TIGR03437 family)
MGIHSAKSMLRTLLALSLFARLYAQGPRVFAPDQALNPGQTVIIPLSLASTGQSITAIQFDLQWDAALSLQFTTGDQLRNASKVPYVAPLATQSVRCVMVGMNQAQIADGELLRLFVSSDAASPAGTGRLMIANALASDANGAAIRLDPSTITIQIRTGTPPQLLPAAAVVNAASLSPGPLSPGEIITLFGLPAASLRIDGLPAPVLLASPSQLNAIVPFGIDLNSDATLEVKRQDQTFTMTLPVSTAAPAVFTSNGTGAGPAAVLNENYTLNSFDNPARPGSVVMVYGTGFGPLQSPPADGEKAAGPNPTVSPVTATIAGLPADVLYAGAAPGLVAGVIQINIRVPATAPHAAGAPLLLTILGASTFPGVTLAIQ